MKHDDLLFLLDVVPINELTDSLSEVIEKYRYSTISLDTATNILKKEHKKEIDKFLSTNKEIIEECSLFIKTQ